MEEATFLESKKDGNVLVLLDGRKLDVNTGDSTYVCCWSPTASLEISEEELGSGSNFFNVNIRNTGNDDKIRARWK